MYSLFTDNRGETQIISCRRYKILIPAKNGGIKPRFEWCDSDPLNQLLEEFSNRTKTRQLWCSPDIQRQSFRELDSYQQKIIVFRLSPLSRKRNRRSRLGDESVLLASLALGGGGLPPGLLLPGQLGQHQHRLRTPPTHRTVSDWTRLFSLWTPPWRFLS